MVSIIRSLVYSGPTEHTNLQLFCKFRLHYSQEELDGLMKNRKQIVCDNTEHSITRVLQEDNILLGIVHTRGPESFGSVT